MPGRRYGGFMLGNKYVRVSRRHQSYSQLPLGFWGELVKLGITIFLFGLVFTLYLSFQG